MDMNFPEPNLMAAQSVNPIPHDIHIPNMRIQIPCKLRDIGYLQGLSPERLHGVIAAMKDKYHELLYLEAQLDVGENASLL